MVTVKMLRLPKVQAVNGTGNDSPILGGPEKASSIENSVELDALTLRSTSKLTSGGASAIQSYRY